MPKKRENRDDAGGGTHGGVAIGRTTGMGAGIAGGGTPGPDEGSGDLRKRSPKKSSSKKGGAKKGTGRK